MNARPAPVCAAARAVYAEEFQPFLTNSRRKNSTASAAAPLAADRAGDGEHGVSGDVVVCVPSHCVPQWPGARRGRSGVPAFSNPLVANELGCVRGGAVLAEGKTVSPTVFSSLSLRTVSRRDYARVVGVEEFQHFLTHLLRTSSFASPAALLAAGRAGEGEHGVPSGVVLFVPSYCVSQRPGARRGRSGVLAFSNPFVANELTCVYGGAARCRRHCRAGNC